MGKFKDIEDAIFEGVEREDHWYGGSLKFKWNYSNEELIDRLGIRKELNKRMADTVSKYAFQFVPYKSGDLSTYVQTFGAKDHGTITYQKPYASKQYYLEREKGPGYEIPDNSKRTTAFHPLASSYWDKLAWQYFKDEITADVDKERRKLCRR